MQMARPFPWSLCCSAGRRRLQQVFWQLFLSPAGCFGGPLEPRMPTEASKGIRANGQRNGDTACAGWGCDTWLLEQLALIWAAQRSQLFMQIKGQWQAGMRLRAILVRAAPRVLMSASGSQFVFKHRLSGQALAEIKRVGERSLCRVSWCR